MKTTQFISALLLAALLTAPAVGQSLLPEARIVSPQSLIGQHEAGVLTRSPNFTMTGEYGEDILPESISHYRTIIKSALLPSGDYADTQNDYINNLQHLMSWDEHAWSDWMEWPAGDDLVTVSFDDLPRLDNEGRTIYYLFGYQVMATDGAVSLERQYGYQVVNFRVSDSLAPFLSVRHDRFGAVRGSGPHMQRSLDILGTIDGEFSWEADASNYGEVVDSYRWGWDLTDPDDPNDPNWALPPGLSDAHKTTGPLPDYTSGIHTLTIQTHDGAGGLTRLVITLTYIPIPDPSVQLPLLLVDDVKDRQSYAWGGENGEALDNDVYRDAFWENAITGSGGVYGFDLERDVIDSEVVQISPRDIVNYRATVWTARWASGQTGQAIASQFRPSMDPPFVEPYFPYNWLETYQEQVGNLLYCGERAVDNFLPESRFILPIVFDSQEGNQQGMEYIGGETYRVGFGHDDNDQPYYPLLFSFSHLGLAAVDMTSPLANYADPNGEPVRIQRRASCAAMKGMVMDVAFRANYNPELPDTIWTDATIDWADDAFPENQDVLEQIYSWGNDEFYDADIIDRGVPINPQDCDGEACVEPMFRTVSRFDWVKKSRLEVDPGDTWPQGYYGGDDQPSLDTLCGYQSLDQSRTTALTNDQVTAYVNHKHQDQKPSQQSDVVMGFDPYRFDNDTMTSVVQWVLIDHFGLHGSR